MMDNLLSDCQSEALLEVRPAELGDLETILGFLTSFAAETVGWTLDAETGRRGILAVFTEPSWNSRYLLVVADGTPIGMVLLTWEWNELHAREEWWVRRLYVVPTWRHKHVAQALVEYLRDEACRSGRAKSLHAHIHPTNEASQGLFEKLGFRPWTTEYVLNLRE